MSGRMLARRSLLSTMTSVAETVSRQAACVSALASSSGCTTSTSSCAGEQSHQPASAVMWSCHQRLGLPGHMRGFAANAAAAAAAQPLIIHESAVRRLQQLQAEDPSSPVYLRVEVEGGGCSGFQYRFALDGKVNPDDIVVEADGARVVSDTVSMQFLQGSTVEFEDSLMRSAFAVSSNPNSDSSCGCGSSFTAKI